MDRTNENFELNPKFMKHTPSYFISFLIVLIGPFLSWDKEDTQDRPIPETAFRDYCRTNNNAFSKSEKLTYKLYYNVNFIWISAGTVTFEIKEKKDHYFAQAIGRTHSGYDWIFKVRDTFQSVFDKQTLLPEESIRIVNEGNYSRYDHVKYLRNSRMAQSKMGKTRKEAELETIPIDQCVHDILSTLYAFRNTPTDQLKDHTILSLDMLMDRKKYPINLKFSGKENGKKVKGIGHLDTYLVEPKLIVGNVFSDEDGMKIWVSQDENKIPLLIESPIAVGKVKAVLDHHSGLQHPPNGY